MPLLSETVLFADDEEGDRFLMREAAKDAGIADRLVEVTDGEEVIAYLTKAAAEVRAGKRAAPRLVILDLSMPRMNGFETLQWIRKTEPWRAMPVLILSGSGRPGDKRTAALMGANAYLVKPSTIDELRRLVAAIRDFWLAFTDFPLEL